MSLSVSQRAGPKGKGRWSWSVELAGPPEELDRVEWVEYTLHPTFSPPVHRVEDRASSFRLDGSGWGEFMIHIEIHHRDGRSIHLEHWLELDPEALPRGVPTGPPSAPPRQAAARGQPAPGAAPPAPASRGVPGTRAEKGAAGPSSTTAPERWLYLSSGLADRAAAARVREAMEAVGVYVRTGEDDLSSEVTVDALIRSLLETADGIVFIVSDRESPWMRQELALARDLKLPTAAVRAGGTLPMRGELQSAAELFIDLPSGSDGAALQPLVKWARELPVRNKRPGAHAKRSSPG